MVLTATNASTQEPDCAMTHGFVWTKKSYGWSGWSSFLSIKIATDWGSNPPYFWKTHMLWCESPSRLLADWHFSTSAEMPAAARHIGCTYAPLRPWVYHTISDIVSIVNHHSVVLSHRPSSFSRIFPPKKDAKKMSAGCCGSSKKNEIVLGCSLNMFECRQVYDGQ